MNNSGSSGVRLRVTRSVSIVNRKSYPSGASVDQGPPYAGANPVMLSVGTDPLVSWTGIEVAEGVSLRLEGITIYGATNAAVVNRGYLELIDCVLYENVGSLGGGIQNHGDLTVTRSSFSSNRATIGGAIYNAACGSSCSTSDCGPRFSLIQSSITNNEATEMGGGLYNDNSCCAPPQCAKIYGDTIIDVNKLPFDAISGTDIKGSVWYGVAMPMPPPLPPYPPNQPFPPPPPGIPLSPDPPPPYSPLASVCEP